MTGYNPADASVSYLLPNGTSVYANEYGKVLRVVSEGGVISDLTRYCYSMNGDDLILTFADSGVSINLTTGILTVPETVTEIDGRATKSRCPIRKAMSCSSNGRWRTAGLYLAAAPAYRYIRSTAPCRRARTTT